VRKGDFVKNSDNAGRCSRRAGSARRIRCPPGYRRRRPWADRCGVGRAEVGGALEPSQQV